MQAYTVWSDNSRDHLEINASTARNAVVIAWCLEYGWPTELDGIPAITVSTALHIVQCGEFWTMGDEK